MVNEHLPDYNDKSSHKGIWFGTIGVVLASLIGFGAYKGCYHPMQTRTAQSITESAGRTEDKKVIQQKQAAQTTTVTDTTATQKTETAAVETMGPVLPPNVVPDTTAQATSTQATTTEVTATQPPAQSSVQPPAQSSAAPETKSTPPAQTFALETYKASVNTKLDPSLQLAPLRFTDPDGNVMYLSSRQRCLDVAQGRNSLDDLVENGHLKKRGRVMTVLGKDGYSSSETVQVKLGKGKAYRLAIPEAAGDIKKVTLEVLTKYDGKDATKKELADLASVKNGQLSWDDLANGNNKIVYLLSGYDGEGNRVASTVTVIQAERLEDAVETSYAPLSVVEDCKEYGTKAKEGVPSNHAGKTASKATVPVKQAPKATAPAKQPVAVKEQVRPVPQRQSAPISGDYDKQRSEERLPYNATPAGARYMTAQPSQPVTINMIANQSGNGQSVSTTTSGLGYTKQENVQQNYTNCTTTPCPDWSQITSTAATTTMYVAPPTIDMSKAPKRSKIRIGHQ